VTDPRRLTRPSITRLAAIGGLALAVLLLAWHQFAVSTPPKHRVTAEFRNTINLYPGAQVKVLGVPVGSVTDVRVEGTTVKVTMEYDGDVTLAADAQAAIVPPSIVGDRYVQLAPAWTSGPRLADGASLGLDHTAVPLELDETYRQLGRLASALGPTGANKNGALSRLVLAGHALVQGNGKQFNASIKALAKALDTLAAVDPNYQHTVDQANTIGTMLVSNDTTIRALVTTLAAVSTQLYAQREDISAASRQLNGALGDVAKFVDTNKTTLTSTISGLANVAGVLRTRIKDLDDLLTIAPVGFTGTVNINVGKNYDPHDHRTTGLPGRTTSYAQRGVYTSNLGVQLSGTVALICQQATGATKIRLAPLCAAMQAAGNDLGLVLSQVSAMQAGSFDPAGLLAHLRAAATK